MLYGGDADLLASQNGTKDYALGEIDKDHGTLRGRCGVNQETGEIDPNMDIENSGVSYAADANYIIFRDINLGNECSRSHQHGLDAAHVLEHYARCEERCSQYGG